MHDTPALIRVQFCLTVFPFCKNPEENPIFAVCFTKQWQDTLLISLHNFLATIFQCMPQPTLTRADTEASLVRQLQDENSALRARLQTLSVSTASIQSRSSFATNDNETSTTSAYSTPNHHNTTTTTATTHQSRLSSFHKQSAASAATNAVATSAITSSSPARHDQTVFAGTVAASQRSPRTASQPPQTINDIVPFDIPQPTHIVDDFYIIAMETLHHGHMAEGQARGLRSLIKNIGSGGAGSPVLGRKESQDRQKRRTGSTGSGRSWTLH